MGKYVKKVFLILFLVSACMFFTINSKTYATDEKNLTKLYFYSEITKNTGSGDCILIENYDENGNKHYGLIDAGIVNNSSGKPVTSVTNFLRKHNVTRLEFFILTHNHADHNGDALGIIDSFQIDRIFMNIYDKKFSENQENSTIYENIIKKAIAKNIKVVGVSYGAIKSTTISPSLTNSFIQSTAKAKESNFVEFNNNNTKNISLGSAKIQIFNWELFNKNGNQIYVKKTGNNKWEYKDNNGKTSTREIVEGENNNSLGVLLTQGNKKAFLAGDINNKKEASDSSVTRIGDEDRIKDSIGDIDLLKLGHHGNVESTTDDFFNTLKPEYTVISNDMGRAYKSITDLFIKNNVKNIYTTQDKYEVSATITNDNIYFGLGTENVINKVNNTLYYVPKGGKYKNYETDLYKVEYVQETVNANSWENLRDIINNNKNNNISVNDAEKICTVKELIINLNKGGNWTANSKIHIETHQKITLVSSDDIKITRGTNLKNDPLFLINGNLSIGNGNMTGKITLDGNKGKVTTTTSLINVELGELNIFNNVVLCNNFNKATNLTRKTGSTYYYTPFGSGIFAKNGTINMYGGEIRDNSQKVAGQFELPQVINRLYYFTTMGAGVYLESASSFNMYGGKIINNKGQNQSNVKTNSKYTNTLKETGIKQQCLGAGIYATRSSNVNIVNGEIKNNKAINDSNIQINGSTINGNTTNIYNTNSLINGVGIYTELSYLNIGNVTDDSKSKNEQNFSVIISDNLASQNSKISIQKNTKIIKNSVTGIRGINVYSGNSNVKISNCLIQNATFDSKTTISNKGAIGSSGKDSVANLCIGGGLCIYDSSNININDIKINNCNSERGGAIYFSSSNGSIVNSTIESNKSIYGGGLFIKNPDSKINIIGSNINNNEATLESGGGIYNDGVLNLNNTNITNNKAKKLGGGIRISSKGNVIYNEENKSSSDNRSSIDDSESEELPVGASIPSDSSKSAMYNRNYKK